MHVQRVIHKIQIRTQLSTRNGCKADSWEITPSHTFSAWMYNTTHSTCSSLRNWQRKMTVKLTFWEITPSHASSTWMYKTQFAKLSSVLSWPRKIPVELTFEKLHLLAPLPHWCKQMCGAQCRLWIWILRRCWDSAICLPPLGPSQAIQVFCSCKKKKKTLKYLHTLIFFFFDLCTRSVTGVASPLSLCVCLSLHPACNC